MSGQRRLFNGLMFQSIHTFGTFASFTAATSVRHADRECAAVFALASAGTSNANAAVRGDRGCIPPVPLEISAYWGRCPRRDGTAEDRSTPDRPQLIAKLCQGRVRHRRWTAWRMTQRQQSKSTARAIRYCRVADFRAGRRYRWQKCVEEVGRGSATQHWGLGRE